jgi:hypothetical protein
LDRRLCHNCDTKPVLAAPIDLFDELRLLILRNLLETRICPKIPAYRLARFFLNELPGFYANGYRASLPLSAARGFQNWMYTSSITFA